MPGVDLCRILLANNLPLPLLILTEVDTQHLAAEALNAGVDDYLVKDKAQNYLQLLPLVLPKVVQYHKSNQTQQQMEETIEAIFSRVERAKQEWEATADALPQMVCLLDSTGHVIRTNRTVETWQLAQVYNVKGHTIHHLFHPNCTQPDCYLNITWPKAWRSVKRRQMVEFEARDKILQRDVLWQIHPILTHSSQLDKQDASFAAAVIQDITERKLADQTLQESLEQKEKAYQQAQIYARELKAEITERKRAEVALQEYTVELQARNEELDAFAHTVAHDLKNPLSPIMGYTRMALENYDSLATAEIQMIFQSILRNVIRMDKIIESLLLLAGVRNMEVELEPLDMTKIITESLERLAAMIE
jgi:PAS domain-containing protein